MREIAMVVAMSFVVSACKDKRVGDTDAGAGSFDTAAQQRATDAARAVLVGEISAATYLSIARSASALRRLARNTPGWREAHAKGDADGDLVPDDRDRCPNTARHTPVDDQGCPVEVDPALAPDDASVQRVLSALGFPSSPKCAGAPVPEMPEAIKFGYDNVTRGTVALAVSPVTNQPMGCPVLYEIRVVLAQGASFAPDTSFRLIFKAEEATETSAHRLVFRVSASSTGERLRLYDVNKYYGENRFQVRAINGGGLVSSLSALRSSPISFGEP